MRAQDPRIKAGFLPAFSFAPDLTQTTNNRRATNNGLRRTNHGTNELRTTNYEQRSTSITEGTIYPLLARLTRDGVLQAEWSATEAPHPRKYYRLTVRGRRRLDEMRDHWRDFSTKIDRLVDAAGETR